jgi:hypothetical protein
MAMRQHNFGHRAAELHARDRGLPSPGRPRAETRSRGATRPDGQAWLDDQAWLEEAGRRTSLPWPPTDGLTLPPDWLADASVNGDRIMAGDSAHHSPIPQTDGAPSGLTGRFAAEWCASRTTSRRHPLQRERGRTGGGVMVRRAILDRDEALAPEDQALPEARFPADLGQPRQHWQGAGGRWLVWAGRAVVWAVLLLVGYRGVLAIASDKAASTSAPPAQSASYGTFPVTLAEAYAMEFGQSYLNFSPKTARPRAERLSRFLAPGLGLTPNLGWNGAGTQRLDTEQVAGISVTSAHSATVTLLATVDGGRMVEVAVPVFAAGNALSVYGLPALVPGPALAGPAPASTSDLDQATASALQGQLAGFFAAYGSGDRTTLARFVTPGARIRSLAGAVTFGGIDSVYAPAGGDTRTITVTVTWKLPPTPGAVGPVAAAPASLQMSYQLVVLRQSGSWDVQSIGALTQPQAQGPP